MKDTVVITNRSNSLVGYKIPELHVQRRFRPGEKKELSVAEIRALSWQKGGRTLLSDHLVIHDEELVQEILNSVEPEYFYTAEDVVKLLLSGSEDQLLDALDFGGDGVIDLIKDKAVALQLNDIRKRNIIQEKTHFNVTGAIEANLQSVESASEDNAPKGRRAAPVTEAAPARRTETIKPKYSVAAKEDSGN